MLHSGTNINMHVCFCFVHIILIGCLCFCTHPLVVMDTKPPFISGIDFHWVQVDDVSEESDQLRGHFEDVANRICMWVIMNGIHDGIYSDAWYNTSH